ncbi:MAG: ElyC/SanA/YdcF family protein [Candidatus Gorgyraea atricola]|nr:ElyC/SanA/YdcF family protein [Candidatus Gorgyraea atricola]
MLKNENIICISSIDWDFIWQGHQEIMSTLAEKGNRVLFIENTGVRTPGIKDLSRIKSRIRNWLRGVKGIRKERENLYIFSPLVLPFPYSRVARWINRYLILAVLEKWMKAVDFSDPIVWTFLPAPLSMDIADSLMKKLIVYYCIDNFSGSSLSAKKIGKSEESLLKRSDLVFVTSEELYNKCARHNSNVYKFPFAVSFEKFEKARLGNTEIPEELKNIKQPIVGYVGGVHKWVDQGLINELAKKHTDYSFVFVGPIQTKVSELLKLKNVHFLGKKEHERLPLFIKYFNVCIIPYLITDYTRNVYPTKLNEYLALGKAVISTPLPEIELFNKEYEDIVCIAEDANAFSGHIERTVRENEPSLVSRRIETARDNSWESRIEKMSSTIEKELERKKIDREKRWKENLLIFYKTARKKAVRFGIICLSVYLLLFKTPFIWFAAEPLKISDAPRKADTILVFGGGVGETGGPGRSTIERARYAAELYLKGYSGKIIFSSGYTYIYNDAENMRLMAVSMGVDERDIILEQKANSTYENVIFSKEILDKNNWHSVLLVSSPYNMRRADLVFDKHAGGVNMFCVPVEKSQFYDRTFGIKVGQIRAIVHEYIGIIYYLLRGYA